MKFLGVGFDKLDENDFDHKKVQEELNNAPMAENEYYEFRSKDVGNAGTGCIFYYEGIDYGRVAYIGKFTSIRFKNIRKNRTRLKRPTAINPPA